MAPVLFYPKVADEKGAIAERKRPGWMPPPLAFPIIWTTIAVLRTVSATMVYNATGTLLAPALVALCGHLAGSYLIPYTSLYTAYIRRQD